MKKLLTFISSNVFAIVQSQELKLIPLLPPESNEHTDLTFLNDELEGQQVVMLGEMTHMYSNIFEMKARIIEYLHQQLGFTTIAMESSMYDLWKMKTKGFSKKAFNNVMRDVWSESLEFQRLVNYIYDNHLKVIGFDSQVKDATAFIEGFFKFCKAEGIVIKLDEDDIGIHGRRFRNSKD